MCRTVWERKPSKGLLPGTQIQGSEVLRVTDGGQGKALLGGEGCSGSDTAPTPCWSLGVGGVWDRTRAQGPGGSWGWAPRGLL